MTEEPGEAGRQAAVERWVPRDLDDAELRRVTRLAAAVTGLPRVTVNVLDGPVQRQLATYGFEGADSPREESMCRLTVASGRPVVVDDAAADERFATSPWVDGRRAQVRAYASTPLRAPGGELLGTLCAFDERERHLEAGQAALLDDLAAQVVALLEARRLATEAAVRERAVAYSEQRLRAVFEHGLLGMAVSDAGRLLQVNDALVALLGRPAAELVGRPLPVAEGLLPAQGRADVRLLVGDAGTGDGGTVDAEVAVVPLPGDAGRPLVLVQVEDVTERRASERRLTRLALHDPLTGLPNRALLRDRLAHALVAGERDGRPVALLFADLDGFKRVNDERGHEVGDRLLVHTARRLRAAVRAGDTVARLGGDEFVVLCPAVSGRHEALEVAGRLRARLARPLLLDGGAIRVGASVGVALSEPGDEAGELLERADAAMYEAKSAQRTA